MKKLRTILLVLAALIAAVVAAVALFISPVAKNYIEKHDQELLGRSIRMEQLKVNIFTGRLRVADLRIGGVDDSTTFFRVDSFDMRLRLRPLLSNRVEVAYITFTGPDVKIYQRGSEFNFDGIINRFASDSTQVEEPAAKPWDIAINDITIRNGRLFYKDMLLHATWGLNNIGLLIPGIYLSGEQTDVGAKLNFAEGGSLETKVAYDMETSAFDIGLRLRDLALPGMLPYLQQFLAVSAVEGSLSADVRLHGDVEHLLSVQTEGTASLSKFRITDNKGREAFTADSLHIVLREADLGKMRFDFDKFYVNGFSTFFEMTDQSNNFAELMLPESGEVPPAEEPESASAEQVAATPDPVLHIAELDIRGGNLLFRDLTMERPFEYTLSDITLKANEFTPAGRNKLIANAHMQKTGSARLVWEGSVSDINNQDITVVLTNVGLTDLSPYSEHYTAYPITEGNLSFRSQNIIRNRHLDGTNHLDVFEPKVDKKRKDLKAEFNVPLKVGLYVLKDKKGHVQMDLPVKGSLDSPEFSYKKIILKTIGNVLIKVVSAPFSFLGGGSSNLEYINIDPQQRAFTSEQYAQFDKIAQMLKDKPEVKIALTQHVDFEQALPAQAANELRMAYALERRAMDSVAMLPVADVIERRPMSMLEYEKILQIDIRKPEVQTFADSMLRVRGIDPKGVGRNNKAAALYRDQAKVQIGRMMVRRNKALADYMSSTYSIQAPALRITPADSVGAGAYTGKHRYTIAIELDGEHVELGAPVDSTAVAAVAEVDRGTAQQ